MLIQLIFIGLGFSVQIMIEFDRISLLINSSLFCYVYSTDRLRSKVSEVLVAQVAHVGIHGRIIFQ